MSIDAIIAADQLVRDTLSHARTMAIRTHGSQWYGNVNTPYSFHLDAVARLCEPYGVVPVIVAYFHDSLEDTSLTRDDIATHFGHHIADLVELITDPKGKSRKERKAEINQRLSQAPPVLYPGLIVKVADRLANVTWSMATKSEVHIKMYRREHEEFRKAVYRPGLCDELWEALDRQLGAPIV